MATEARSNLRQDLIKAGLSTLAADLLANLFAAQQKQFEGVVGVLFPNVDRPWGVKPYPASAASGVISAGMLVRTTPNSLVPATGEGGDANLWANAFVMGVVGTGATAQIYTAQGAASALLMVNEPVAGEKVSLLRGGMGTCSSITGSYDLQPVAQCEVSQTDTGGLALCSGIAFQTPLNQSLSPWLDARYLRLDTMNDPLTGDLTIDPSPILGITSYGQTIILRSAGIFGGANGLRIACAATGSDFPFFLTCLADPTDLTNLERAFRIGPLGTLKWHGIVGEGIQYLRRFTGTATGGDQYFYLPDALAAGNFTITCKEVAQTWSAVQTSSVAKNYAGAALSKVGFHNWAPGIDAATEAMTDTAGGVFAFFPMDLPAGTVVTGIKVKSAGGGDASSGVTVTVLKRVATGTTEAWTTVDGPDTFLSATTDTNTMTFASPETLTADTSYAVKVESVVDAGFAELFDIEFITTSQPFA